MDQIRDKAIDLIITSWLTKLMGQGNFDESTVLAVKKHFIDKARIQMEKVNVNGGTPDVRKSNN